MSISKLKIALVTTAIGFVGFASPAYAQITVEDRDTNELLEQIRDNDESFRDDDIKPHYEKQIEHYEAEIKRLDAMIKSLSYFDENGDYQSAGRDVSHFDIVEAGDDIRDRVTQILEGQTSRSGLDIEFESIDTGSDTIDTIATAILGESQATAYLTKYGFLPPQDKHGEDGPLQRRTAKLYSALYVADNMVGDLADTRLDRLQAYENLRTEAKETQSVQQAIEVNNALLIENGRNLALLIDLQMVKLNAEAVTLRQSATSQNKSQESFGSTALGTVALAGISSIVNEVTE